MSSLAGALRVKARTEAGKVTAVRILSPRSPLTAEVFVGRPAAEAAPLAQNLFSLCPVAQSLAAQACIEAAQGFAPAEAEQRARLVRLLAERLGEMLRANMLDWPEAGPDPASILALRGALKGLRALPLEPAALAQVRQATEVLGLYGDKGLLARQMAEAVADNDFILPARPVDALTAQDDGLVAELMTAGLQEFARAPALPGRRVETGAGARQGVAAPAGLAQRLASRFADMRGALDQLELLIGGGEAPEAMLASRQKDGLGFAAVESARGRLFHQVRLDRDGQIAAYAIVAPTEWNFHSDGPFVHQCLGAQIGGGAAAQDRLARLALVFDPCVPVKIEIATDQESAGSERICDA